MSTDKKLKIVREEITGPVSALISFKDDEDAVRIANDTTYALAAGLWTRDISRAHTVARVSRPARGGSTPAWKWPS